MKRAACRWPSTNWKVQDGWHRPVEKCSLHFSTWSMSTILHLSTVGVILSRFYCLHFLLYNGSCKIPSMSTTALFSVDVDQTALFDWSTLTTAVFYLVDTVDVHFYCAFHHAQYKPLFKTLVHEHLLTNVILKLTTRTNIVSEKSQIWRHLKT